jgi:hypothetical protein
MNDNDIYIVQCTKDNFEDVQCTVQMFARVIDMDREGYCIKTFSLDSMTKRRLCDMGASFWPEAEHPVIKSRICGKK